jgi:hypothetical protein
VIAVEGVGPMALTRGRFLGYEFDRMVMLFSMVDGQREIPCTISTSAMDDLEGVARSRHYFAQYRLQGIVTGEVSKHDDPQSHC